MMSFRCLKYNFNRIRFCHSDPSDWESEYASVFHRPVLVQYPSCFKSDTEWRKKLWIIGKNAFGIQALTQNISLSGMPRSRLESDSLRLFFLWPHDLDP